MLVFALPTENLTFLISHGGSYMYSMWWVAVAWDWLIDWLANSKNVEEMFSSYGLYYHQTIKLVIVQNWILIALWCNPAHCTRIRAVPITQNTANRIYTLMKDFFPLEFNFATCSGSLILLP